MSKFRLWGVFLLVLLVAIPLQEGISLAEDNYTLQYIETATGSGLNYLTFLQGISGINLNSFSDKGLVSVGFDNVDITGIYTRSIGIGSYRNQGSVALINVQPGMEVAPTLYSGQMFSQGNKVTVGDYDYTINLNFSGFRGSGLVVLNAMAGSFCNQFTSLTFNMGKNAIPQTTPSSILSVTSNMAILSNQQMQAMAATADNDFKTQGKQSAVATIQGVPNVQGVCAITLSAGVNNQVSHNVSVNVDTAK
jgi:hypothetical protein